MGNNSCAVSKVLNSEEIGCRRLEARLGEFLVLDHLNHLQYFHYSKSIFFLVFATKDHQPISDPVLISR